MRAASAIIGLIFLAVGLRWLQLFIFTGYRAHSRSVIIPLGVAAIALGLFMLFLSTRGKMHLGRER